MGDCPERLIVYIAFEWPFVFFAHLNILSLYLDDLLSDS